MGVDVIGCGTLGESRITQLADDKDISSKRELVGMIENVGEGGCEVSKSGRLSPHSVVLCFCVFGTGVSFKILLYCLGRQCISFSSGRLGGDSDLFLLVESRDNCVEFGDSPLDPLSRNGFNSVRWMGFSSIPVDTFFTTACCPEILRISYTPNQSACSRSPLRPPSFFGFLFITFMPTSNLKHLNPRLCFIA